METIRIKMITSIDPDYCRRYLGFIENEKQIINFIDGEPEDNNIGRNFSDCYKIKDLLEKYYQYGKEGRTVEFSKEVVEWDSLE